MINLINRINSHPRIRKFLFFIPLLGLLFAMKLDISEADFRPEILELWEYYQIALWVLTILSFVTYIHYY